jgi:hypothetical protein
MSSGSIAKKSATSSKKSAKRSSSTAPVITTATTSPATVAATQSSVVAPIGASVVAQCIALLGQVRDLIGPVEPLSATDIRHALKLRKGGVQVVTQVFDLCTHHGITAVGPVTIRDMSAQLARATALNQIAVPMAANQKMLSDAAFSAESACWQAATALYTTLQRLAIVDPTLATGLQPVTAFFKQKKAPGAAVAAKDETKLLAAEKAAAKHPSPKAGTDATPAAAPSAGTSATATPGVNDGSAPTAPVVPAPTGAAHS